MPYFIKVVGPNMEAFGGFIWPTKGVVRPEKWTPNKDCGDGLHAFRVDQKHANGLPVNRAIKMHIDHKFVLMEARETDVINIGGKYKLKEATVIGSGNAANIEHELWVRNISTVAYESLVRDLYRRVLRCGEKYERINGQIVVTRVGEIAAVQNCSVVSKRHARTLAWNVYCVDIRKESELTTGGLLYPSCFPFDVGRILQPRLYIERSHLLITKGIRETTTFDLGPGGQVTYRNELGKMTTLTNHNNKLEKVTVYR